VLLPVDDCDAVGTCVFDRVKVCDGVADAPGVMDGV
jgi:hypothetical protein